MRSESLIRDMILGATLAASAAGVAGTVAAQEKPFEGNLQHESFKSERFTGALEGVAAPKLDGPIRWSNYIRTEEDLKVTQILDSVLVAGSSAPVGAVIGLIGAAALANDKTRKTAGTVGAAIGATIAASTMGAVTYHMSDDGSRVIEFPTTVASIESIGQTHDIKHHKAPPSGPYFPGLVMIPESTLPLAADSYQAPLVPGQKIIARFEIDPDGQIKSWVAFPGLRDSAQK